MRPRNLDDLRAQLRAVRQARGLSQTALAQQMGWGHSTLSQWETGRRNPAGEGLFAWANALGFDLVLTPQKVKEYRGNAMASDVRARIEAQR